MDKKLSSAVMQIAARVALAQMGIKIPPPMEPHDFNADVGELSECQHCGWGKDHPIHQSREEPAALRDNGRPGSEGVATNAQSRDTELRRS